MFKNLGSWLGIEDKNVQVLQENETSPDVNDDKKLEVNKPCADSPQVEQSGSPTQLLEQAKGFSGYIYNFASSASKKLSDSVVGTAQTLKKTVEDGKINNLIDQTIIGDFHKEQEKFIQEKNAKSLNAAVPPWVGYNDEDTVQQQILALSVDKRNFLRDPPAGVNFNFNFEEVYPVAMVMLEEDELLRKMRFHLVPKQIKEENFWRNYFYRVSLIKQSAQLTALAAQQEWKDQDKSASIIEQENYVTQRKPPSPVSCFRPEAAENHEVSTSPPVPEFVSDAFDSCNINEDDLRKEMEQLVLNKDQPQTDCGETPDWEQELQEELQEYDVLAENQDYHWDQEIEMMLKDDS